MWTGIRLLIGCTSSKLKTEIMKMPLLVLNPCGLVAIPLWIPLYADFQDTYFASRALFEYRFRKVDISHTGGVTVTVRCASCETRTINVTESATEIHVREYCFTKILYGFLSFNCFDFHILGSCTYKNKYFPDSYLSSFLPIHEI